MTNEHEWFITLQASILNVKRRKRVIIITETTPEWCESMMLRQSLRNCC